METCGGFFRSRGGACAEQSRAADFLGVHFFRMFRFVDGVFAHEGSSLYKMAKFLPENIKIQEEIKDERRNV